MAAPTFMGRLLGLGGTSSAMVHNPSPEGGGWPRVSARGRVGSLSANDGSAPMLTFYFAPGSSSMAPHIGLHEVGAPFEPRPMSFKSGELQRPEYLALN